MIKTGKTKDQLEEGYKLGPTGEPIPDYDTTIKYFDEGDLLKGTVVQIDRYEVLVDVGYKSEGVIPLKELTIKSSAHPKDIVEIGQEIETVVLQKEDSEGRLILSKKRADFEKAWEDIEKANKEGTVMKGRVIEIVRGGLILNIGVRGFLPASLIDTTRVKNLDEFLNQELECKVIEINRNRNNVVLSRKAVLSNDRRSSKHELVEKLTIGETVKGKVSSIVDFGAFVDLGGIDGLVHISEMSWEHINHPSEVLSVGQEVEVQVLDIDNKKSRVSLGLKQTQDDPWKEKVKDCKIDQKIKGKVSKILPFGVFIDFAKDLEGLIHISELAPGRVVNANEVVEVGQEVEAKIIGIDVSRRRISLSIKQLQQREERRGKKEEVVEEKVKDKEEVKEKKAEEKATASKAVVPSEARDLSKKAKEEKAAKKDVEKAEEKQEEKPKVESGKSKVEKGKAEVKEKKAEEKVTPTGRGHPEEAKGRRGDLSKKSKTVKEVEKPEKKVKKTIKSEDEALLEKLAQGPTKIEDEKVEELPEPSSLEDVLEQMKKSHGAKK